MDPYLENEVKSYMTDKCYYVSEPWAVASELAKTYRTILEQKALLQQANDKILRQEKQLKEASQILELQQKLLRDSKEERDSADIKLQNIKLETRALEEKCLVLESTLSFTHCKVNDLLCLVTPNEISGFNDSRSFTPRHMKESIRALEIQIMERLQHEIRLKCEVGILRNTLQKMQRYNEPTLSQDMAYLQQTESKHTDTFPQKELKTFDKTNNNNTKICEVVPKIKRRWIETAQSDSNKDVSNIFTGKESVGEQAYQNESGIQSKRKTVRFACSQCGFTYMTRALLLEHQQICCTSRTAAVTSGPLVKISLAEINSSDDEYPPTEMPLFCQSIYLKSH